MAPAGPLGPADLMLLSSSAMSSLIIFLGLRGSKRWPDWAPEQLGKLCRPIEVLGEGGFSIVYKAKCRMFGLVAVKIPRREALKPAFYSQFRKEASSWIRVSSAPRGVVRLLSVLDTEPPVLIVELAEKSLDSLKPPLDEKSIVEFMVDVAEGLAYAHSGGILHLDVKPSNILYVRARGWGLTDWGLARSAHSAVPGAIGTPGFASPEQLIGGRVSDKSDVYGLAATAYYMAAGRYPYDRDLALRISHGTTMAGKLTFTPPPPSNLSS